MLIFEQRNCNVNKTNIIAEVGKHGWTPEV